MKLTARIMLAIVAFSTFAACTSITIFGTHNGVTVQKGQDLDKTETETEIEK